MTHTVTVVTPKTKQVETYKATCSCGWQGEAASQKFIEALSSRHLLLDRKWPFQDQYKTPVNWDETTLTIKD